MNLPVISETETPWYADGLRFTCSQCGNCCTGGPGYVWISKEEVYRLAEYLKISPEETVQKYCRKIDGMLSLKERRRDGMYDCIFLTEEKVTRPASDSREGEQVIHTKRGCSIYPVRPLQCRTWPFWPEIMKTEQSWNQASRKCHGMNVGSRKFTREQMEALRDAKDWPQNPPTSAAGLKKNSGV